MRSPTDSTGQGGEQKATDSAAQVSRPLSDALMKANRCIAGAQCWANIFLQLSPPPQRRKTRVFNCGTTLAPADRNVTNVRDSLTTKEFATKKKKTIHRCPHLVAFLSLFSFSSNEFPADAALEWNANSSAPFRSVRNSCDKKIATKKSTSVALQREGHRENA